MMSQRKKTKVRWGVVMNRIKDNIYNITITAGILLFSILLWWVLIVIAVDEMEKMEQIDPKYVCECVIPDNKLTKEE